MIEHRNPYVGPRAYLEDEADLFFGRDTEGTELVSLVVSEKLVLFYAESGAGKSSLINTRLIPSLRGKGFEVLPVGRVGGEPPSETRVDNVFVYNLLTSLDKSESDPSIFSGMPLKKFLENINTPDGRYYFYDDRELEETNVEETPAAHEVWPRALIIDQFEEIFTTNLQAWSKRKDFFRQLRTAMKDDPYLWVVLAMREDYIAKLDPYAHLLPGQLRARFYMQRMKETAAISAIKKPAELMGRTFSDRAAAELVDNLLQIYQDQGDRQHPVRGEFVEPVQLQVVCRQLWDRLEEVQPLSDQARAKLQPITYNDLTALVGAGEELPHFVDNALAQFYEQALKKILGDENIKVTELDLRNWFTHELITEARTRDTVFLGQESARGIPKNAVQKLETLYLLRAHTRPGGAWYELTHDRFIEPILQANQAWLLDQPLMQLAQRWDKAGRPDGLVLGPNQLNDYLDENWRGLGPLGKEFVETSQRVQKKLKEERREEQEAQRRREEETERLLLEEKARRAQEQVQAAEAQRQAAQSLAEEERRRREAEGRRNRYLLISVAAVLLGIIVGGFSWLRVQAAEEERENIANTATAAAAATAQSAAATATAQSAAATATAQKKQQLTEEALILVAEAKNNLDSNLDLSLLLAKAAADKTNEFDGPSAPEVQEVLAQAVWRASILNRERSLNTTGSDGSAKIWPRDVDQAYRRLSSDLEPAALSLQPNLPGLALASLEGQVEIWETTTLRRDQTLTAANLSGDLIDLAIMQTGDIRLLMRRPQTTTLYHWPADNPLPQVVTTMTTANASSPALSPDGTRLAWVSEDRQEILVKNIQEDNIEQRLPLPQISGGAPTPTLTPSFIPTETLTLLPLPTPTPSSTPTATPTPETAAISLTPGPPPSENQDQGNRTAAQITVLFSPAGKKLAAIRPTNEIIIFEVESDAPDEGPVVFTARDQEQIIAAGFNHAGTQLAAADRENRVKIFDLTLRGSQARLFEFPEGDRRIVDLAFSTGDTHLVISESKGPVHFLNLNSRILLAAVCDLTSRNLTNEEWRANRRDIDFPVICPEHGLHPSILEELLRDGKEAEAEEMLEEIDVSDEERAVILAQTKISLAKNWIEQNDFRPAYDLLNSLAPPESVQEEIAQAYILLCGSGESELNNARAADACRRASNLADNNRELHLNLCRAVGRSNRNSLTVLNRAKVSCNTAIEQFLDEADHSQQLAGCEIGRGLEKRMLANLFIPLCQQALAKNDSPDKASRNWNFCYAGQTSPLLDEALVEACRAVSDHVPSVTEAEGPQELTGGQGDVWKFTGNKNEFVTINMSDVENEPPDLEPALSLYLQDKGSGPVERVAPDAGQIGLNASLRYCLPQQGATYFIKARDLQERQGQYILRFSQEEPVVLPSGEPGSRSDSEPVLWKFDGREGEVVTVEVDGDGPVSLTLRDENCNRLREESRSTNNFLFFLSDAGVYFIEVEAPAGYTITLNRMASTPIAVGDAQEGPADSLWELQGETGQVVDIAVTGPDAEADPDITLLGRDGQEIASDNDSGPGLNARLENVLLTRFPTYVRIQENSPPISGVYVLSVTESIPPPRLEGDQVVRENLKENTLWIFEGRAGELATLSLELIKGSVPTLTLSLISPDGQTIATTTTDPNNRPAGALAVIPDDDRYFIKIDSTPSDEFARPEGAYRLELKRQITETAGSLAYGRTISESVAAGLVDYWTFSGRAGEAVKITPISGSFDPYVRLYNPNGELIGAYEGQNPAGRALIQPTEMSGTYGIAVSGVDDRRGGAYTLALTQTDFLPILAWTAYTDRDEEYENVLKALERFAPAGYEITPTDTTDAGILKGLLQQHSIFLILEQDIDGETLVEIGVRFGPVLEEFVRQGGRVVSLGKSGDGYYEGLLRGMGLLDASYTTTVHPGEVEVIDAGSPVVQGLPSQFEAENLTAGYRIADRDVTIVAGAESGEAIVATRSIGSGQVILIGYDYYESNANADRLLVNAVFWPR